MKLLIFGGLGFIGTNITLTALERGHQVVGVDNLSRRGVEENLTVLKEKGNFKFIWGDIRNQSDFVFLNDIRADCIINLAANSAVPVSMVNPVFDFEINARGHLNVLEFARKRGTPVILASSNKVYTDKLNRIKVRENKTRYIPIDKSVLNGFDESADMNGYDGFTHSPYGVSKVAAEKYSREYNKLFQLPIVINRMSCIYGEYQKGVEDQGWVDWFLRAKRHNLPLTIFGDGKQIRDVLFGKDLADLYLMQAENMGKVDGKTFNVGGGSREGFHTSLLELIDLIDKEFPGKKLRYSFREWRKSDQKYYISDISLVQKVTGWKPSTNLIQGLRKMWENY